MELMEQDSFKKEQEKIISYIEEVLKKYLPKTPSYQKNIYDAMEYSVMAGGEETSSDDDAPVIYNVWR